MVTVIFLFKTVSAVMSLYDRKQENRIGFTTVQLDGIPPGMYRSKAVCLWPSGCPAVILYGMSGVIPVGNRSFGLLRMTGRVAAFFFVFLISAIIMIWDFLFAPKGQLL